METQPRRELDVTNMKNVLSVRTVVSFSCYASVPDQPVCPCTILTNLQSVSLSDMPSYVTDTISTYLDVTGAFIFVCLCMHIFPFWSAIIKCLRRRAQCSSKINKGSQRCTVSICCLHSSTYSVNLDEVLCA